MPCKGMQNKLWDSLRKKWKTQKPYQKLHKNSTRSYTKTLKTTSNLQQENKTSADMVETKS